MKKILGLLVAVFALGLFAIPVLADINAVTPSTNDQNKINGWAYVDTTSNVGSVTLTFVSTRNFYSCFEVRTDGDISEVLAEHGGVNYNTNINDGLYRYYCEKNSTKEIIVDANQYLEVRMVFGAETDERFDWTRFDVLPAPVHLTGKDVKKATGGIWMSGPSQQMQFSAFDQGDTVWDKGIVEYWNYDYPGSVLNYTANVLCANVDYDNANTRFMFQIPAGWPGLSGLYVVVGIHDGGTPGTNGDTYAHAATPSLSTATQWCETDSGFSPSGYAITAGNLVVHK